MSLTREQKVSVAKNAHIKDVIQLLQECKTPYMSLIGDDAFKTQVIAITMESEAGLIGRFIQYLLDIEQNKFHDGQD